MSPTRYGYCRYPRRSAAGSTTANCRLATRALLGAPDPVALSAEVVRRGLNVRATERLVQRRSSMPQPTRRPQDADTMALERELAAALGLRVTLEARKRGGRLTLHYVSLDQLDRVLSLLRAC